MLSLSLSPSPGVLDRSRTQDRCVFIGRPASVVDGNNKHTQPHSFTHKVCFPSTKYPSSIRRPHLHKRSSLVFEGLTFTTPHTAQMICSPSIKYPSSARRPHLHKHSLRVISPQISSQEGSKVLSPHIRSPSVGRSHLHKSLVPRFSVAPPEGHKHVHVVEGLLPPAEPPAHLFGLMREKTQRHKKKRDWCTFFSYTLMRGKNTEHKTKNTTTAILQNKNEICVVDVNLVAPFSLN